MVVEQENKSVVFLAGHSGLLSWGKSQYFQGSGETEAVITVSL